MVILYEKQFCLLGQKILGLANGLPIGKGPILLANLYMEWHTNWLTCKEKNHLKVLMKFF